MKTTKTVGAARAAEATYDVAIIGCGPVGAMLANFLRRYGHSVAIFDRDLTEFYAPRAYGLDDETIRTMQTLGLLDRFRDEGHYYHADIWFLDENANPLMSFDADSLGEQFMSGACGHHYANFFDQPSFERLLREDFHHEDGADAYLGYEVTSVQDEGSGTTVTATEVATGKQVQVRAAYTVGCDGQGSLVRKAMGSERIDLGYTEDYLVIDGHIDDEEYFETAFRAGGTFTLDPKYAGVIAKGCHGMVRFDLLRHPDVVKVDSKDEADFEEAAWDLIKRRGYDVDKIKLVRHAPYTFHASMPEKWRKGRLLLAGDAAHVTPPWSGQGLNMGVRDAANVSFKLDLVLRGAACDVILDTYPAERQEVSWATIKGAVDTGKLMQAKSPAIRRLRTLAFGAARNSRTLRRALWNSWQRKPAYKDGLIGKTHDLSGSLMPQPRVTDDAGNSHLLDDVLGLRFALLTTSTPEGVPVQRFRDELGGIVLTLGKDVYDYSGELGPWLDKHDVSSVLIRPDRYVFDAGNSPNDLCRALFGSLSGSS